MREVLFRGKRIDNGEWVYGSLIDWGGNGKVVTIVSALTEHDLKLSTRFDDVIPKTVGQYTGLTDKNGKKIFEGDIIAFHSSESIYEAAYDITDSKFVILLRNGKDSFLRFYNISAYYFSVIANKWDNPELLEVEQ